MSLQFRAAPGAAPSFSPQRLFLASCIALIATAMTFAIRGDIMDALGTQFHLSKEQVGGVAGIAFLGFTISILIGGPLCDLLGMGRLLAVAFLCHAGGIAATIAAPNYATLWTGTLLIGMGNGLIEAAVNPLIATVYADRKTHMLNRLHAWFPGGIVIGGVLAYALSVGLHASWQMKMATILVPVIAYGLLFLGQTFPQTERVQSRVTTGEMIQEAFRPLFLVWLFCMLLTGATELANEQWIPSIFGKVAGPGGILVVVWINTVMYLGRSLAGPVVHRISPVGLLAISSALALGGLLAMSAANTVPLAFAAATLFALGVCYYWPTMLGVTSERFPKGGSLLLALMGGAGMLSVNLVLPLMGRVQDLSKNHPGLAFRDMAVLPVALIVIFGSIYAMDRKKGGYRPETLGAPAEAPVSEDAEAWPPAPNVR